MTTQNKKLNWFYSKIKFYSKINIIDLIAPEVYKDHFEYVVKIIDEDYKLEYHRNVSQEDFKTFIKIMSDDKTALLLMNHEILGEAARIKLKYGKTISPNISVVSSDIEELINKSLKL